MLFFFFGEEAWRQYTEELGLQQMSDYLKNKGYGYEWPLKVFGPEEGATFHQKGGRFHRSPCPCYEGYWWAGGFGAVQCSAAGELLPGAVYETMCGKGNLGCPFRKGEIDDIGESNPGT